VVIKRGTNAADTLIGAASADTLYGVGGNDGNLVTRLWFGDVPLARTYWIYYALFSFFTGMFYELVIGSNYASILVQ
jgi:hypothetical protein